MTSSNGSCGDRQISKTPLLTYGYRSLIVTKWCETGSLPSPSTHSFILVSIFVVPLPLVSHACRIPGCRSWALPPLSVKFNVSIEAHVTCDLSAPQKIQYSFTVVTKAHLALSILPSAPKERQTAAGSISGTLRNAQDAAEHAEVVRSPNQRCIKRQD